MPLTLKECLTEVGTRVMADRERGVIPYRSAEEAYGHLTVAVGALFAEVKTGVISEDAALDVARVAVRIAEEMVRPLSQD